MPAPPILEIPNNGGTVAIIADLHFQSYRWHGGDPFAFHGLKDRMRREPLDALIVAGDLSEIASQSWDDALNYLGRYVPADRIFIVPGNHDYFGGRLDDESSLRTLARRSGGTLAQKKELRHRDDRYLCATLWTDFELCGDRQAAMDRAARRMRDYDLISKAAARIEVLDVDELRSPQLVRIAPADTIAAHHDHRRWLEERLASRHFAEEGRTFVVTHHGPHPSVAGAMDDLTPAFHSNLQNVIAEYEVDTWFFGHSHRRLSSVVATTRLQNVSLGYAAEEHNEQEDDLAKVCFVPIAQPQRRPRCETGAPSANCKEMEQDLIHALKCREAFAPVLVEELSPDAQAFLREHLNGCVCPVVPQGDAYFATDVILALGRKLRDSEQ